MIKDTELREFRPIIKYSNDEDITLDIIRDLFSNYAVKKGILVSFTKDQVKSGGLFNSSVEECLVMYHPEHEKDYFKFCIRVKKQGIYCFVSVNDFGQSKQMKKANTSEFSKQDREGKDLSYKIGSLIGEKVRTIGGNRRKWEEEEMYYQCITDILDEIIS